MISHLVESLGAEHAVVEGGVEERSRLADGQRAVGLHGGARPGGGVAVGAPLAGQVQPLGPEGAQRAGLAVAVCAQLLAVGALLAALGLRDGLLGAGGQADAAEAAGELALLGLVLAEAARPAQVHDLVEVLADRAALLALVHRGGREGLGHALLALQKGRRLNLNKFSSW